MSKMDSLLIYTQRREKRTVTMKLRICDLSIIFFFAASHSPLKISQPPLKIPWPPPPPSPISWGLYPIYVDLTP